MNVPIRHRRARGSRRGSMMVEFALSWPLALVLLAGMFQFGYAFFVYGSLRNAVHAGARFGSVSDYKAGGTTFETRVKNIVVYGSVDGGDKPVVPGLSVDDIVIEAVEPDGTGIPRRIQVRVSSYDVASVWTPIRFENKPVAAFPYMGQFIAN